MSQDQGRSSKPTARYESDEAPLLPPAGAGEDDDFVVEAGAFGSGKVLDARPLSADDSAILAETGGSSADLIDRDAMTITDRRALEAAGAAPEDPNSRTRAAGDGGARHLGSFDLERKVGQGGMGEVWLARQRSLDRLVAVKVLPRSLASQESFLERFQREARAAASLKHPHVIQVYEFGIEDGTPYFAMEYVEGEDLQQVMRRERYVNLREAVEVVRDVASALEAAHAKGIIHRDIKPSNVMIDRDGIVKVMDFGLAKATASDDANLTNAGLIMGTPNYLSPEQGRGDPLDSRSDLYSLGVVFYELLAGKLPFRADTPAGLIFKHVYEPPPDLLEQRPDLPPFLVDVCNRLLQKDRGERYPNAAEVLADLDEFLDNAPHYMDGGARRPGAGSENAHRVASGRAQAIRRAARRRADSDRNRSESGIKESVTEAIDESSIDDMVVASGSDVGLSESDDGYDEDYDDDEGAQPTGLGKSSGTYPTPDELPRPLHDGEALRARVRTQEETRREERPARGPQRPRYVLWGALAALILAGVGLRFGAPDATAGFFHRQAPGLAQPLSSVGILAADPRPRPLPPTQLVFETPELASLPADVRLSLIVGEGERERAYPLTPGELNALAPGGYTLRYTRPGYLMDLPVELVAIASPTPGSGKLKGAEGVDPWAADLAWTPNAELLAGYRSGLAALDEGRAADAAAALEAAVALDPDFTDGGGPSAAALLARARGAEGEVTPPVDDPPSSSGDFDPRDPASVQREVKALRISLDSKRWRKVLADLQRLEGLESADPDAHRELSGAATEALKEADQEVADFQIKLEDGTLGKAGEALEAVHLLDPFRPDFDALKATLERARTRRELAFSSEELSFEERKERLDAYLELAKHDEAAANRLREVKVELKRQAELRALEGALRELAAAGAWTEAKQKAEELRLRDEGNAVAAEVGAKARLELDRDAILALVSGFDETLVGDPEALASLLPNPTERRAWKDFLAFDGRFSASKHTIDREAISVSGQQAELEGLWAFELALLDQPAQALERRQRIALERTDQGWTFRSFEVLE